MIILAQWGEGGRFSKNNLYLSGEKGRNWKGKARRGSGYARDIGGNAAAAVVFARERVHASWL